jgi:folylpolyglutamate synthase
LQLTPDIQRTNGSVALAAVRRFLQQKAPKDGHSLSLSDISKGVSQFSWPGRFQLVLEGPYKWFLDGAHNEMSVSKAAEWFMAGSLGFKCVTPLLKLLFLMLISGQSACGTDPNLQPSRKPEGWHSSPRALGSRPQSCLH